MRPNISRYTYQSFLVLQQQVNEARIADHHLIGNRCPDFNNLKKISVSLVTSIKTIKGNIFFQSISCTIKIRTFGECYTL